MGTGASIQDLDKNTDNLKNSKTTNPTKAADDIAGSSGGINFTSQIKAPTPRPRRKTKAEPELPDISSMDDSEACDIICSELDQALAGHYTFILSSQPEDIKPNRHQVEKLLEEQGYKNPDLTDATQRQLVKSYLQKKKASPAQTPMPETPNQMPWPPTPDQTLTPHPPKTSNPRVNTNQATQESLISDVLLHNRALIAASQNQSLGPIGKRSLSKLETHPRQMPPLDPIGIEGARWVRPQSLKVDEAVLVKNYRTIRSEGSNERMFLNDEGYRPQIAKKGSFDASKFAAANDKLKKPDLDIYSETTYKEYNKKLPDQVKQISLDSLTSPKISSKELDMDYNPAEEALLAAIESEYM